MNSFEGGWVSFAGWWVSRTTVAARTHPHPRKRGWSRRHPPTRRHNGVAEAFVPGASALKTHKRVGKVLGACLLGLVYPT